jgi:tetratricopeptide (TPR) repeat protein
VQAAHHYAEALALLREQQNLSGTPKILHALGEVAWAQGKYAQAAHHYAEALAMSRKSGQNVVSAAALYGLGKIAHLQGDYPTARQLYQEALAQRQGEYAMRAWRREARALWGIPRFLEALASLAVAQQQMEPAARLFGATAAWHIAVRFLRAPIERTTRDSEIAAVRTALGEEAFASAWVAGQAMTLEQAVAVSTEIECS